MTGAPLLKVEGLSTHFTRNPRRAMLYGLADLAADVIPGLKPKARIRQQEFGAVNDLSFTLERGEALAICGRNGAGKTTLLRAIAGLLRPAQGSVSINGRVNSIIELGRGLIPHLTGRENARLNLVWRGVPLTDLRLTNEKLNDFAELGDAFDQPVGSYSSGMRSRLAFAIAISTPCDLMLVDEALAVGDMRFQHKCLTYMKDFIGAGGALLLVSHDLPIMQSVCKRGLLIEEGRLVFDGSMEDCAIALLKHQNLEDSASNSEGDPTELNGTANALVQGQSDDVVVPATIEQVVPLRGVADAGLMMGDDLEVGITFSSRISRDAMICCIIWTSDMNTCISIQLDPEVLQLSPGRRARVCRFRAPPIMPGKYRLQAHLIDPALMQNLCAEAMHEATTFDVQEAGRSNVDVLRRHLGELVKISSSWFDAPSDGAVTDCISEPEMKLGEMQDVG